MKRFPSSDLEGYLHYRAGADRETLAAWDRYTNAFNIGSFIGQGTMFIDKLPAAAENPTGFLLGQMASYDVDQGRHLHHQQRFSGDARG